MNQGWDGHVTRRDFTYSNGDTLFLLFQFPTQGHPLTFSIFSSSWQSTSQTYSKPIFPLSSSSLLLFLHYFPLLAFLISLFFFFKATEFICFSPLIFVYARKGNSILFYISRMVPENQIFILSTKMHACKQEGTCSFLLTHIYLVGHFIGKEKEKKRREQIHAWQQMVSFSHFHSNHLFSSLTFQ